MASSISFKPGQGAVLGIVKAFASKAAGKERGSGRGKEGRTDGKMEGSYGRAIFPELLKLGKYKQINLVLMIQPPL